MDTISLYKHRIDALMDILFGAGVSNPQTIIEQLNYLLFLRALSIKDDEAELLGITDESEKIFSGELAKYRWQNLLALNAEDLFKTLEASFDVLQKKSKNPTVKLLFRNAHIKIFDKPTLRRILHEIETFSKELDAIAHEGNKDVFGDMYEYLLSKLSSAGTNGQFRTPRHIIDFMVKVVDPKKNETILDPACGTAGFLVAAYRYIAGEYTSDKLKKAGSPRAMDKLSADEKNFLFNHMFTGFDSDEDMIKFGMMNLHLHGLTKSRLARQNSLTDTSGMKDKFDVILANPPFAGKIDEESVSEDLRMGTKATELLFLRFMMDRLSLKGKLAVIVPEGVVFNASKAHAKIRQMLIEKGLWAVVSLPSGVFNPYAGVKTSLLFLDKEIAKTRKELLFIKIENDGFDLGAQRKPIDKNDLPEVLGLLNVWKSGKEVNNELVVCVDKIRITESADLSFNADRYRIAVDHSKNKWPVVKLGDVCELQRGVVYSKNDEVSKDGYKILRANNISIEDNLVLEDVKLISKKLKLKDSQKLRAGDIFICLASGSKAHVGKVAYICDDTDFYFGGFMGAVRRTNENIDSKFLFYLLKDQRFNDFLGREISGANINNLNFGILSRFEIPLPPIEVQKQIAIELNTYQKVIDGAKQVTENWKPKIEVDPSWKKVKLGDVCETSSGGTPLKSKPEYYKDGTIPWLRSGEVAQGFVTKSELFITDKGLKNSSAKLFPVDTVLVAMYGATAGQVGILKFESSTNQAVCGVLPNDKFVPDFLFQALRDQKEKMISLAGGGAQPNISQGIVRDLEVPLPSLEVQRQIVDRLQAERVSIEAATKLIPMFEQKIKDRLAKLWD